MENEAFQKFLLDRIAEQSRLLTAMHERMKNIERRQRQILPQEFLHTIPRPERMQKEFGRDPNVAAMFRKLVKKENESLPPGSVRTFISFPDHHRDEEINDDMKRTVYGIMCEILGSGWERKTWTEIYARDKKKGELVVKEASMRPEIAVVAQGAGEWGVRLVIDQKQKSVKRAVELKAQKKGSSNEHTQNQHKEIVREVLPEEVQPRSSIDFVQNNQRRSSNAQTIQDQVGDGGKRFLVIDSPQRSAGGEENVLSEVFFEDEIHPNRALACFAPGRWSPINRKQDGADYNERTNSGQRGYTAVIEKENGQTRGRKEGERVLSRENQSPLASSRLARSNQVSNALNRLDPSAMARLIPQKVLEDALRSQITSQNRSARKVAMKEPRGMRKVERRGGRGG